MAERILTVRVIGDASSLNRSFRGASASAGHFDRSLTRATRGALAGSGAFRSLGRSLAFASGGFLAFASIGQFFRTSVDAAKEAQVTQKQLGAQFRASGKDLKVYQDAIDKTANRLSLLAGFQNDEIKAGFTTIFRTTGNVTKALRDTATAADLARAKHLSFAQASLIVAKTEAGNTTLLRRQGFQIAKNATAEEALATLRRVVAGQARAGTTAQERFGAVLHNTEEIIGLGLLPTLNKYLASSSRWLTQMNESGRLQRDVAKASSEVADAARTLKSVVEGVDRVTGGFKQTLELLIGIKLLPVLASWRASFDRLIGAEAGAGLAGAASSAGLLRTRLKALAAIGTITIVLDLIPKAKPSTNPNAPSQNPVAKFFAQLPVVGGIFSQTNRATDQLLGKLGLIPPAVVKAKKQLAGLNPATRGFVQSTPTNISGELRFGDPTTQARIALHQTFADAKLINPKLTRKAFDLGQKVAQAFIDGIEKGAGRRTVEVGKGLSLQGHFNLAELRLAQAQLTAINNDDRAILVIEEGIVKQQVEHAKKLKDRIALTQQLAGIVSQIRGIDEADAATAKEAAAAAKERAKAAREHTAAVLQQRQFRVLNLDASGQPFTPNVRSLKKELGTVSDAVKGTFLDTGKTQSVLARIRRLLTGHFGALAKDVRATVKQMLDDVNQQLKDHSGGPETKFQKADLSKLVAGFGLSAADKKALESRLSLVGAGRTVPHANRPATAGGFGGATIVLHNHTHLDGREVEHTVTRHKQKRDRRNPPQKRGPFSGGN